MSFLSLMERKYAKPETATLPKNLADAKKVLAALGIKISYDRDAEEYTVNYMKNPREATAYFTNDLADAVMTGKSMASEKANNPTYE